MYFSVSHSLLYNKHTFILILRRYYKNAVSQESGWNAEAIRWCQQEAERQNLKSSDYWGGLVLDEMKIQVH